MSTTTQTAQLNQDLAQVGESWANANRDYYAIGRLPVALFKDVYNDIHKTTYHLPALSNGTSFAGGAKDFDPGDAARPHRKLQKVDVEVTPISKETDRISRPLGSRPSYADLESNVVNINMAHCYQSIDILARQAMQSTTLFGSAKTFTNGGGALQAHSDHANQRPDADINLVLLPMRRYRGPGASLEMHLDRGVADILGRHPAYTGAGTGSAIASALPIDVLAERLKSVHSLDRVVIYDGAYNEAAEGQTEDINGTMNGLLFVGLFDRRKAEFDCRDSNSTDAPDGALCIGLGKQPYSETWDDKSAAETVFVGRFSCHVFSPRGSTHGAFWASTGAGGIYTSLP